MKLKIFGGSDVYALKLEAVRIKLKRLDQRLRILEIQEHDSPGTSHNVRLGKIEHLLDSILHETTNDYEN